MAMLGSRMASRWQPGGTVGDEQETAWRTYLAAREAESSGANAAYRPIAPQISAASRNAQASGANAAYGINPGPISSASQNAMASGANAAYQPASQQRAVTGPTGSGTGVGGSNLGNASGTREGYFFSPVVESQIGELVANPELAARWYGKSGTGRGGGRATENILNNWTDPGALLLALGYSNSAIGEPEDQLTKQQALWDQAMGVGSGPNKYIDASQLVSNILSSAGQLTPGTAPGLQGAASKGAMYNADARLMAENVTNLLLSSLQGQLTPTAMATYENTINDLKADYLDAWMTDPTTAYKTMGNFAQFLQSKLGPNLGL